MRHQEEAKEKAEVDRHRKQLELDLKEDTREREAKKREAMLQKVKERGESLLG